MSQLLTSASYLLLAITVAIAIQRFRRLRLQLAATQLKAARLRRHMERLEMVLKQTEPEVFAQVKARSDMEWQQPARVLRTGRCRRSSRLKRPLRRSRPCSTPNKR